MNSPSPSPHDRWNALVSRARADTPPPLDLSATLRAVRAAAPESTGWLADFTALFATRSAFRTCLLATAAFAAIATWQAWNFWETLPWIQLVASANGGLL